MRSKCMAKHYQSSARTNHSNFDYNYWSNIEVIYKKNPELFTNMLFKREQKSNNFTLIVIIIVIVIVYYSHHIVQHKTLLSCLKCLRQFKKLSAFRAH